MKIAYVVVGEDLASPLLRRQVVEMLARIKEKNENIEITIFNFQSPLAMINHFREWKELSKKIKILGLRLIYIPNLCPWPIPNLKLKKLSVGWRPYSIWNKQAAIAFFYYSMPIFFLINKFLGFHVFHCRSYISTSAALLYKNFFKQVKVIFDPRSDYPEEGVTAGYWSQDDQDFNFWKEQEKILLEKSSHVALIGPTYLEHYKKDGLDFNYFFAPNNVDIEFFKPNSLKRKEIRERLKYSNETTVFVYLGALTEDGWHRSEFYKIFYDQLKKTGGKFSLLLLIPEVYAKEVSFKFANYENVTVISPAYHEVGYYLSSADIGLMFFHRKKIAVGTKIGEYLCAGLPVVVNNNCIGAVDLINRNCTYGSVIGLGIGDDDRAMSDISNFSNLYNIKNNYLINDARDYFDLNSIASTYEEKYKELGRN